MKKFLVTLVVIILAVSVGFGVFYLVKDNEVISLKAQTIYKDAGDPFEINLDMENPNSYTTVTVSSSDESVVKVEDSKIDKKKGVATGTFTAVAGGNAKIVFKTNNAKFRNIGCDVIVCDGSLAYPYRIDNAEELQRIGAADEEVYTTDKHYVLTDNIDLGSLDQAFTPIPSLFGTLDGKGYTISNLVISGDELAEVGLFRTIYGSGVVKNVKFDNVTIEANNKNVNIGVVAGINKGTVQLVEIKAAHISDATASAKVGGVVGYNESTNLRTERTIARIDRVSANVTFGSEEANLLGNIGGICGDNNGGIIINSYTKGTAYVKDATLFGGIVAINRFMAIGGSGSGYEGNIGANVKDCYSIIEIKEINTDKMGYILAENRDNEDINKIVGNYYVSDGALKGMRNTDIKYGELDQNGTTNSVENNELKNLSKLVSYIYYDKKIVVEGDAIKIEPDTSTQRYYYWDMDVWQIDLTQNDGYPILTYEDEYVDDNFEGSSTMNLIDTYAEFDAIRNNLGGTYVISKDIDLSEGGDWTPIGTEDKPFTGNIFIADSNTAGVTISNLKITSSGHKYVGLFGVTKGAYISGINMANVTITGSNSYAGAIAGQNGGTIDNCKLISGKISATIAVGGIAGENSGRICGVSVDASDNDTITITKLSTKSAYSYGAGGIAGINYDTITVNETKGLDNLVSGNVIITAKHQTNIGGVAGQNEGSINAVYVTLSDDKYGIISDYAANAGGVAGYSTGSIQNAYVSSTISAKVSSDGASFAGGIVGSLNANDTRAIYSCVVGKSYINANTTGGAVGTMTTTYQVKLDIAKDDFKFNGAQKVTNVNAETQGTMEVVAVENEVTLEGSISGGLVGTLTKGIVRDCYTKALLSADENAGIVHTISLNQSTKEGGVIFRVYSTASHKQGTSYAVSTSEVHNNWNIGLFLGESADSRNVGFIFDYYYEESSNLKNPKVPDPLKGVYELIDKKEIVYNSRKLDEMKTKGLWSGIFSDTVWGTVEGSLPTLYNCERIKGSM